MCYFVSVIDVELAFPLTYRIGQSGMVNIQRTQACDWQTHLWWRQTKNESSVSTVNSHLEETKCEMTAEQKGVKRGGWINEGNAGRMGRSEWGRSYCILWSDGTVLWPPTCNWINECVGRCAEGPTVKDSVGHFILCKGVSCVCLHACVPVGNVYMHLTINYSI